MNGSMNYADIKLRGIDYEIVFSVDSDGDYSRFDVYIGDYVVNDELRPEVIAELECKTWQQYIEKVEV